MLEEEATCAAGPASEELVLLSWLTGTFPTWWPRISSITDVSVRLYVGCSCSVLIRKEPPTCLHPDFFVTYSFQVFGQAVKWVTMDLFPQAVSPSAWSGWPDVPLNILPTRIITVHRHLTLIPGVQCCRYSLLPADHIATWFTLT